MGDSARARGLVSTGLVYRSGEEYEEPHGGREFARKGDTEVSGGSKQKTSWAKTNVRTGS